MSQYCIFPTKQIDFETTKINEILLSNRSINKRNLFEGYGSMAFTTTLMMTNYNLETAILME